MALACEHVPAWSGRVRWPGQFHWCVRPRAYARGRNPIDIPLGDTEIAGLRAWCPCGCGKTAVLEFYEGARENWDGNLNRPTVRIPFVCPDRTSSWSLMGGQWVKR